MSWRRILKTKTKDVFKASSRRFHQDECLLGNKQEIENRNGIYKIKKQSRKLTMLLITKKIIKLETFTLLFYKRRFFQTQLQCCLYFSWIELQILLRRCLIHMSIIILRHYLYLLYLCLCLGLGPFMSYLCDLFFIFNFIFIKINRIISWIQRHLFFCLFMRIFLITFGC